MSSTAGTIDYVDNRIDALTTELSKARERMDRDRSFGNWAVVADTAIGMHGLACRLSELRNMRVELE